MDPHPPVDAEYSSFEDSYDSQVVDAAYAYVMMKKNTRVSRNIRACWFFKHLSRQVSFTPPTSVEGLTEELNLVSVIPKNTDIKVLPGQSYQIQVGPDTIVTFLSYQYKLSVTLDLSPSMMTVDIQNGSYVYDGILQSLSRCLHGLVMPLDIPGSCIRYSPEIYISVICHTPVVCSFTNQVLVQGVKINQTNIDQYIRMIGLELKQFEVALSSSFASLLKLYSRKESFFLEEDEEEDRDRQFNLTDHIGTPEAGFTNMLRYGILSLQLLPENSSSGIIIITDGIVGLPNSYLTEMLLNQMRNNTTMCSFIKVGSPSSLYRKLAQVPHIELMQAIATATFGAYLGVGPDVSEETGEANLYHRALLFWSFQRGLEGFKYDLTHNSDEDMPGSISWIKKMIHRHPITKDSFGVDILRKEREKRTVKAGLHSVLSVRLREGYTIKCVTFKKDYTEIHVKLLFPWRDYGKIEYAASAAWPLNYSSPLTHVEVVFEGSYDVLHEMLCKSTTEVKSNLRLINIKTLWTILERISSTDKMLEHLQSFSSEPEYYQTPESIRSGVPLFYIQSDGPSLNTQLKASTMEKFASFWKAVIQLDTNNWQKWLHSHRIGLVLEHDRQFPKCFQVPNASSRFSSIQCRQALTSLSLLLSEWSTFVLAENHSYIKFLQQEQDKPPKFFCVLRLTSNAPSMIIRLGFLGGTPASIRQDELQLLRQKIRDLCFPQRGTQKTLKKSLSTAGGMDKVKPYKSPLNREGSEIACCVLLRKPVEKILVVYESKPRDMTVVKEDEMSRKQQDPMKSVFRTLTHYLQHQRWVWNIQGNKRCTLHMNSLARMLATITKLRLQEGFHFAVSNAGVTNLVLEVDMKETDETSKDDHTNIHPCVVQYIIFPPHTRTSDDSLSEDDRDDTETTEADGEVQIVTECWVEPQYGVCCNNTPERQHFNGLTYMDIAKAFYPYDYECISSLSTFEHLVYLCDNTLPSPDLLASRQSSPPSTPGHPYGKRDENFRAETTVNFIPFPFDLLSILPRSQQAELLFSTFFINEDKDKSHEFPDDPKKPNEILLDMFYDKLKEAHSHEVNLTSEDCKRVIGQITERARDLTVTPGIPFTYRCKGATSHMKIPGYEPSAEREASSPGNRKQTDMGVFKSYSAAGYDRRDGAKLYQTMSTGYYGSADTSPDIMDKSPEETDRCPSWKCFVKKDDTADHLLLTFVPASYEDLCLLHQVQKNDQNKVSDDKSCSSSDMAAVGDNLHPTQIPIEESIASPEENVKSSTAVGHESVTLLVYVYSCQLKNLTNSLVNRWASCLPDDIFEDMTFKLEPSQEAKPARGQFLSFQPSTDDLNNKDSWRSSLDRRSTDSNSFRLESFKEHCKLVSELYLSSFVIGVFRSLQHNYYVDRLDVDSAINNICEESHPLETDMTSYLLATCSHLHHLVEKARVKEKHRADSSSHLGSFHKQQAVRFQEMDFNKEEEAPKLPEVLLLPQQTVDVTEEEWASMLPEHCAKIKENIRLIEAVKARFKEAIEKCLCPVPSLPDFYFYYPSIDQQDFEAQDDVEFKRDDFQDLGDNADETQDLEDLLITKQDDLSGGSSLESNVDDLSFDYNMSNVSIERDPMPLFVHFTCTVKQKSDYQHTSLQAVPQCFSQITRELSEPLHVIDFSDFKITFDINCLTLLNDVDQPMPRKPSYRRHLSNLSQTSAGGQDDTEDKITNLTDSAKPIGDPVSHLPKPQHAAVYSVKDEIEYLMQEEVISSLRSMHPITADTLLFVAKYINTSAKYNSRTVMYQTVSLQFVYGSDQSLKMFIEELEKQTFSNCRLTKEGDFYFLIVNKNLALNDTSKSDGDNIMAKDERSLSLPSVFSGATCPEVEGSRSLLDMGEEGSESRLRPRSCSDAVSLRMVDGEGMVKAVISLPEANNDESELADSDPYADHSLKKSSSFAGLQVRPTGNTSVSISRSRHCSAPSGHNGVISLSIISSKESTTDDGSDIDESDISGYYSELPDYWLLIQVHSDKTEVFFHSRELMDSESQSNTEHKALYTCVINTIQEVCKKVNQALLLKEVNKTKVCNSLLVPEADEDFKWTSKRSYPQFSETYDMDEEDSEESQGYLAAAMDFVPGHFSCDVVFRKYFSLPPRLNQPMQRGGSTPMGLLVLRQALNNFVVTNRKNMFVIEELVSKNVFYLRLKENPVMADSCVDQDTSFSQGNIGQPGKSDCDTVSVTSSSYCSNRCEEIVELTVHGTELAGKEIKDDLMKMLQNKLDDALLEAICFMLRKNPQCKLKPDDVTFIQKPGQAPTTSLLLTIPGHCSMYLVALMYYLRQNLLQFLHTPNYVDPASQFQDCIDDVTIAIPSDKVYIYIRPEKGGGKGIACVSVNLVDGQCKTVKLLNCPSPTKNNMPSLCDPTDFDKYVQTTVHEKTTSSRPGPTALISFHIWECGHCDIKILSERLMAAVRHSLCDIVMEYFMLTTPICSVPRNLTESCAAPVSSLPASPTKLPVETAERKHNPLTRKFSVDPPRSSTQTFSLFSSFGELRITGSEDKIGKCLDFNTAPSESSGQFRTSSQAFRLKDNSLSDQHQQQQAIAKYENGEKGQLHPVFCSLARPWMEFCHKIGVPSMVSYKLQLQAKFCVEFVIKEFQQSIISITTDTSLRIFKVIQTNIPQQTPQGFLFTPCKTTPKDIQMNRVVESIAASGGEVIVLAVGRSAEQWQGTVLDHQDLIPNISPAAVKGYKNSQKFMPQIPENKGTETNNFRLAEKDFIPRQKLILIACEKKQMTVYMYNFHNDMVTLIEKTITRITQWNNARSHVLDSVIAQKMGLFHHFQFSDLHYLATVNPYTQTSAEVDSLIRHHAPNRDYQRRNSSISHKEKDKIILRSTKRMVPFDQTFKNVRPPRPMGRLMCSIVSDPVSRHGQQAQEIRIQSRQDKAPQHLPLVGQLSLGLASPRKDICEDRVPVTSIKDPVYQHGMHLHDAQKSLLEDEERNKVYQLYLGWSTQNSGRNKSSPPITEDYLTQLKKACRLFHYCATPLIFCQSWRHNVVQKTVKSEVAGMGTPLVTAGQTPVTTPATPDKAQKNFPNLLPVPSPVIRSRHSSGASNLSSKNKPGEDHGRKGSEAGITLGSLGRNKSDAEEEEEAWHVALRKRFAAEYERYLISELSFTKFNVQPSLQKSRTGASTWTSGQSAAEISDTKQWTVNLQKTLTGGIIVMELSFRQEFFCVKMFTIDCSQFKINVNEQMHLLFVDECDKYKDLIHVHSFAHDFHLRCVENYLSNEKSDFPVIFNLDSFLTEFKLVYPYPPSFSRNCLLQDSITLADLPFTGSMLYESMMKEMGTSDLKGLYLMGEKFALVSHEKFDMCTQSYVTDDVQTDKSEVYDARLIIIDNTDRQDKQADAMKLVLKYFTILTRKRDCYPLRSLEKVLEKNYVKHSDGSVKALSGECQLDMSKPVAVRQHICLRKEHVNYRGYTNLQQLSLMDALCRHSDRGRAKILEMVKLSKIQCRRDFLWRRLMATRYEDVGGDSKRRTSPVHEDGNEQERAPLNSEEFVELLQSATLIPLREVDPSLTPLNNMPYQWYHSLMAAIRTKFQDHCTFFSPNKKTQYLVVFNANDLKMFSVLSLTDSTHTMEHCCVLKEPLQDCTRHTPSTPNLPLFSLQTHTQNLVDVYTYLLWSTMCETFK